jgi:hypothetical protein
MKNYILCTTFAVASLCAVPVASEAGPLRWLKEGFDYVTSREATDQARNLANKRAARDLARSEADTASRIVTRQSSVQQFGRVSTAFQVGVYTFSGVMIVNTLASAGYAMSETVVQNEEVAQEIAVAVAEGENIYREKYCQHPRTLENYVVPEWTASCGDGSAPAFGKGIELAVLRQQAG